MAEIEKLKDEALSNQKEIIALREENKEVNSFINCNILKMNTLHFKSSYDPFFITKNTAFSFLLL